MAPVVALDIEQYERIVILTGAGVSAGSGLPTYRGAGGLWNADNVQRYATAEAVRADPRGVWKFFAELRASIGEARPNRAHAAMASLERRLGPEQKLTILTQNVDGLHAAAGSSTVIELHGTLRRSRCTRCDYSRSEELARPVLDCPECPTCAAWLRPDVVFFDEFLPVDAERAAKHALRDCDLFLAVGTSGTVAPAANYVRAAKFEGARTLYVNLEPLVPRNPAFDEIILGPAEDVLPALFGTSP
jgi:NAD-dependent deacetylase